MTYSRSELNSKILDSAIQEISNLIGNTLNVLEITKPPDIQYAIHLAKVVSKLSPLIGNMLEFFIASFLNKHNWIGDGHWIRQDPAFPDILYVSPNKPQPGIEIKTWFPLATEITARFKDSVVHFEHDQVDVVLVAWIPEYMIYGKPKVIGIWYDTARSLAEARDKHYHSPPYYLVFEPRDTSKRAANLQQTNTNGYVFQGTSQQFEEAKIEVESWGSMGKIYDFDLEYQKRLHSLQSRYPYRLDTNFAKMDRIKHKGLEEFKGEVMAMKFFGRPLSEWSRRDFFSNEEILKEILEQTKLP